MGLMPGTIVGHTNINAILLGGIGPFYSTPHETTGRLLDIASNRANTILTV